MVIKTLKYYKKNNNIPSLTQKKYKRMKVCNKRDFNEKIIMKVRFLIKSGILNVNNKKINNSKIINLLE